MSRRITLEPMIYDGTEATDFGHIFSKGGTHKNTIFLFNDNFSERDMNKRGRSSAVIRPFAFTETKRAVAIPTGWSTASGGFKKLTTDV